MVGGSTMGARQVLLNRWRCVLLVVSVITTLTVVPTALADSPRSLVAPALSGTPRYFQSVTCDVGLWANDPTSFQIEWRDGGSGRYLGSGATYTPTPSAIGSRLLGVGPRANQDLWCRVAAINADGRTYEDAYEASVETAAGAPKPRPPTLKGTLRQGSRLTCVASHYARGTTLRYVWATPSNRLRPPTTVNTYVLKPFDDPATWSEPNIASFNCSVIASNRFGSVSATSPERHVYPPGWPVPRTPVRITGSGRVGQRLACDPGRWTNHPHLVITWLVSNRPVGHRLIYTPTGRDQGTTDEGPRSGTSFIDCYVVASTGIGRRRSLVYGESQHQLRPTAGAPVLDVAPQLSTTADGDELRCTYPAGALHAGVRISSWHFYDAAGNEVSDGDWSGGTMLTGHAPAGQPLTCRAIGYNRSGTGPVGPNSEPLLLPWPAGGDQALGPASVTQVNGVYTCSPPAWAEPPDQILIRWGPLPGLSQPPPGAASSTPASCTVVAVLRGVVTSVSST